MGGPSLTSLSATARVQALLPKTPSIEDAIKIYGHNAMDRNYIFECADGFREGI